MRTNATGRYEPTDIVMYTINAPLLRTWHLETAHTPECAILNPKYMFLIIKVDGHPVRMAAEPLQLVDLCSCVVSKDGV